jgi:thiamine-monophosphate kinase
VFSRTVITTVIATVTGTARPRRRIPDVEKEAFVLPPADRTVAEAGEDPLVAGLITRYPGADWLVVGPGDDAAVLDLATRFPGQLVFCTDTLVEGQDFRRDWSTARDVGIKAAAQNYADIAAMGGRPHALLVSLTTPGDLPEAWARELADGLAEESTRAGAVVAGGDLSAGAELVVTGTALGTLTTPRAVLRSGARPGDVVAIAGVSGRSGAGWALLLRGFGTLSGESPVPLTEAEAAVVEALVADHRRPRPPYEAGPQAAAAGASAMIDTSDGLLRDSERLARASGVVLDLESAALQPDADLIVAAGLLAEGDPLDWVLSGGEDHALLACFPPSAVLPEAFRRIGTVRALNPPGAVSGPNPPGAVLVDGQAVSGPGGWHHFA